MSTIVTRATKGSALTWTEGDANITNLNADKIENVVEDTTPQLGGNLDVNGNSIVSTSNANINITPNGTGRVVISGQSFPAAASSITGTVTDVDDVRNPNTLTLSNATGVSNNDIITFTGTGVTSLGLTVGVNYKIWALIGGGAAELALASGGGTISITDPGTITDVNYSIAGASATVGQVLTYGSSGNLSWANASSGGITSVSQDTNPQLGGNLNVNGNNITNTTGDSRVSISGIKYPNTNGSSGQALISNGTGQADWTTLSTGATTLDELSDVVLGTPATNELLQYNGTNWVDVAASSVTVGNVSGTVAIANGGTGQTSAPAANAALNGFTTTATAAGITTLTNTSSVYQLFTGTSTQSVRLPSTATLAQGWSFHIVNNSTSNLTLQNATPSTLGTIYPGTTVMATCISTADNTNASWEFGYTDFSTRTGTGAVVLSASPTLTSPNLGEPTSLVVTNATGTASININGTVGATTASTGRFTTVTSTIATGTAPFTVTSTTKVVNLNVELVDGYHADEANTASTIAVRSAGGIVTATGFTGTIGQTTKAAGTFTTMTADTAVLDDIRETVFALTYGATITPNAANGSVQTVTLTGNVTFSAFTTPVSGQTITLIITQDATGSRTLTSTMKFAGGSKTLSTAANAIDILTVSYIGTTYYASLAKGFA